MTVRLEQGARGIVSEAIAVIILEDSTFSLWKTLDRCLVPF